MLRIKEKYTSPYNQKHISMNTSKVEPVIQVAKHNIFLLILKKKNSFPYFFSIFLDWLFLSLQVKNTTFSVFPLFFSPNYNNYANKSGETRQAEKADGGLKWCQHRGYDTSPIWEVLFLLLHRRRKWTCTVYLYICQWGDPGRGDASASVWGTLECKLAPASTHPLWFDTTRAKTENWEENEGRSGV